MFITREPFREARSAASKELLDMIGEAPTARQMFAARFWTTRLVMLWQRGLVVARRRVSSGMDLERDTASRGWREVGEVREAVAKGGGVRTSFTKAEAAVSGSGEAIIADTMAMPSRDFEGVLDW